MTVKLFSAKTTGCTVSNIKSRLRRVRQMAEPISAEVSEFENSSHFVLFQFRVKD